ncbi:hypothetical protein L9F63_016989, partial [Diploptera punctata]
HIIPAYAKKKNPTSMSEASILSREQVSCEVTICGQAIHSDTPHTCSTCKLLSRVHAPLATRYLRTLDLSQDFFEQTEEKLCTMTPTHLRRTTMSKLQCHFVNRLFNCHASFYVNGMLRPHLKLHHFTLKLFPSTRLNLSLLTCFLY